MAHSLLRDAESTVFQWSPGPSLPEGEVGGTAGTLSDIALPSVDSWSWRASDKIAVKQKQKMFKS